MLRSWLAVLSDQLESKINANDMRQSCIDHVLEIMSHAVPVSIIMIGHEDSARFDRICRLFPEILFHCSRDRVLFAHMQDPICEHVVGLLIDQQTIKIKQQTTNNK